MTAFLNDTFSGTGAIGTPNWVKSTYDPLSEGLSKYVQSGGYVDVTATPTVFAMYNGTPPSADYVVEAGVAFVSSNNGQSVELGLRGVNVTHSITGYYAEISWIDAAHVGVQIWSQGGGPGQLNGTGFVSYPVTSASSFIASFQIQGTALTFSLNGVTAWTGTDSTYSATGVPWMFFNYGTAATDVRLDYFTATSLVGTPFWTDYVGTREID